jgi:hypothetical protein
MTDARVKAVEGLATLLGRLTWDYEAIDVFEALTGDEATAAEMRQARRDGNYVTSERRVAGALLNTLGLFAVAPALVEAVEKARKEDGGQMIYGYGGETGSTSMYADACRDFTEAVLAQLRAKP